MDIELTKATDSDKEFLLGLRKLTMVNHLEKAGLFLSDQQHLERINKAFEGAYIALQLNQKIGLLKYLEFNDFIEILQLQILPNHQGKGIGKHLLNHINSIAKQSNKKLVLKVLKDNPAKFLYERNGFRIVGEDPLEFHMEKTRT